MTHIVESHGVWRPISNALHRPAAPAVNPLVAPSVFAWTCGDDGVRECRFQVRPGLYRLSIALDAAEFDWDSLYIVMSQYGNVNERTGPWDFNELENNRPLVPAYWFHVDGNKLGLGYFNRPSSRQVRDRRLDGEFGVWVRDGGEHVLRMEPHHPFRATWRDTHFDVDPDDRLDLPDLNATDVIGPLLPASIPHNRFTDDYLRTVPWAHERLTRNPVARYFGGDLAILATAYRWRGDAAWLQTIRAVVNHLLRMPNWGNPQEDGYGHNGDMAAASAMWGMAAVLGWVPDAVTDLQEAMLARLARQGDTFVDMALLHRGYWGGSVLQEHGFRSTAWFTAAAYALRHRLPESARRWLGFGLPRIRRTLHALPTDGIVPTTSYHRLFSHVDALTLVAELHRRAVGENLLDHPSVRAIPAAAMAVYCPTARAFVHPSPMGDLSHFVGGQSFLAQFPDDPHAAWLLDRFLESQNVPWPQMPFEPFRYQHEWLWAMLLDRQPTHPVGCAALVPIDLAPVPSSVRLFVDSGVAALRAPSALAVVKCGPCTSHNAYANATGNTDRLGFAPLSGHFVYLHQGTRILSTADGGYRMYTGLGNTMLVDGQGQRGDEGMPMSHPDMAYYGEAIDRTLDDGVSMNLTPAYEGLDHYRRTLRMESDGGLWVTDEVACTCPRTLQWRFQTYARNAWRRQHDESWRLCVEGRCYRVTVQAEGFRPVLSIQPTKTVWGYVNFNEDQSCHHLRVETEHPTQQAVLRYHIQPTSPCSVCEVRSA